MNQKINTLIKYVDDNLRNYLLQYSGLIQDDLYEGMVYACFGGGKRIRPLILLSVAESLGLSLDKALPYALAIELFHSYSLVHDDLPGMDNDIIRRGKPTVHVKFGQGLAILIGDALLNSAFELLFSLNITEDCVKTSTYISCKTGAKGMIGGQAKDILHISNSLESILKIYEGKTCALFQASIVSPAILLGLSDVTIRSLEQLGLIVGTIFQINDDISDSLIQSEISNYITTAGMEDSIVFLNFNREQCKKLLVDLNLNNSEFNTILKFFNII